MKSFQFVFQPIAMAFILLAGVIYTPAVYAHAGEEHGDGAAAVQAAQALAPRAEAKSEEVELLAVISGAELTLFLSRFNTNAPIDNAALEIESGSDKAQAKPVASGAYKAAAPWLARPGRHGMVVTLQGQGIADLLELTLEVPDPAAASGNAVAGKFGPVGLIGSFGGIALLGVAAIGVFRRKKQERRS